MAALLRLILLGCVAMGLAACTPGHTVATGQALAGKVRLQDGVTMERGNQRLLSHQTQVCLASDERLESRSALEAMQRGFGGYFQAVGIDSAPQDFASVLRSPPCPGAQYVFYVHVATLQCRGERAPDGQCQQTLAPTELIVTIINRDDGSLADRLKLGFTRGLLSSRDDQGRLQRAFAQVAAALTGVGNGA